jgi:hypothetical protein
MPYLLRDQIAWTSRSPVRWGLFNGMILVYGAVTLAVAMTQY